MELKDVILSTLAEIEEITQSTETVKEPAEAPHTPKTVIASSEAVHDSKPEQSPVSPSAFREEEIRMLEGIRERLLVLFEGFQSPNNAQIEAKVDLTLNFLEYLLATIDNRLDTIKK